MIVGCKDIDMTELYKHSASISQLAYYSNTLIPKYANHIPDIAQNQRYITALHVRKLKTINYARRMELSNGLLEGVHINGLMNSVIELEEILTEISITKLLKGVFSELLNNSKLDE